MMDPLTVLGWTVGSLVALNIAIIGVLLNMSFQLGKTIGRLDVLIAHGSRP